MKRKYIILLHLAYWLLYLLLLSIIISVVYAQFNQRPAIFEVLFYTPIGILCFFPNLLAFYTFYLWLFPSLLARRKIPALIAYGSFSCLVSALLGAAVLFAGFYYQKPLFRDLNQFSGLVIWLALVAAIHGGIALVIRGFTTWYGEIKLKEELARKTYEMELALVKSQLNPHFLFNTINNIDVLITRDAARASAYLNQLSDILRYAVYQTKTENILLTEELNYLEKYLELQKIRTANPGYVNYSVKGNAGRLLIAPMLFFPFIENAFKHTEDKKTANSIIIKLEIAGGQIIFECENTYQNTRPAAQDDGGLGNELIERRLMLLYPKRHTLEIEKGELTYRVKLVIDAGVSLDRQIHF